MCVCWGVIISSVSSGERLMFELLFCSWTLNVPERGCAAEKIHVLICERSLGELDYTDGARLDTRVTRTALLRVPNRLRVPSRRPIRTAFILVKIKLGHLLWLLPSPVSAIIGSQLFPAPFLWSFRPLRPTGGTPVASWFHPQLNYPRKLI